MNTRKDFLYFIVNSQGQSIYVKPDGTIGVSTIPHFLESTPDGWQEISIMFGRSKENPGIYRSYTVPIKAVLDGGQIIKHLWATEGIQANYYLVILKLNRSTNVHEEYFSSKLDFKKYLGDDYGATITVLEGGLVNLIKNKGNETFEIPVDVPEAVTLVADGITLRGRAQFLAFNGDSGDTLRNHTVALNQVQDDGSAALGARGTQRVVVQPDGSEVNATGQYFLQPNTDSPVTVTVQDLAIHVKWVAIGINPSPTIAFSVLVRIQEGDTVIGNHLLYNVSGVNQVYSAAISVGKTHMINGTYNFTVPQNAKAYLLCFVTVTGSTGDAGTSFEYLLDHDNQITVDFLSRYGVTRVKTLRPEYVFNELVKKISNNKYTAESLPLRTEFKNTMLTCGDAIRSLQGAVIKTTLNDFVKSYGNTHGIALSVTDRIAYMEKHKFFFSDTNIIDLTLFGDVAELQTESALEYIMSTIDVGCPNQTYDDLNGRDEVNTTFKFSTAITEQENKLDLVTPYRKDAYGLEFHRINLAQKKTTDSQSDNDLWMVDIAEVSYTGVLGFASVAFNTITLDRFQSVFPGSKITISGTMDNDGVYDVVSVVHTTGSTEITVSQTVVNGTELNGTLTSNEAAFNRPVFDSITGVIAPDSIFNTMLSPKRSLLANGDLIHSGLDLQDNTYIEFRSADKNDKLSTALDGVTITERANVFVGNLPPKLFKPVIFTFSTQVPLNLVDIMALSPGQRYGKVKFQWKGVPAWGYIMSAGQVPQLNPSQTWKLLCAPETDVLKLITA